MQVDFNSCAGELAFAACLITRQSLPPTERNETEPTPECHQHATAVTIYVKLKWTNKMESTWWNVLPASRRASAINVCVISRSVGLVEQEITHSNHILLRTECPQMLHAAAS